jgi:hypothetical protein
MRHIEPLISIVVATKDRYETLFDCVNGLLINYRSDEVEILVRDNSATPRVADCSQAFAPHRNVHYWHDAAPVSQSENYELAVERATGRYVTMIGDDDGVAGGLVEAARWMDRHAVDAFYPNFSVYLWPGVEQRFTGANEDGWLSTQTVLEPPRMVSADAQRRKVLAGGCTSLEELPRLYYGLVSRRVLDQIRVAAGCIFPGPSPDMANAFALSYFVRRFAVGHLPIFIAGNSRKSNAGLGLRSQHVGEIAQLPFLPRETAARWSPDIPFFWSGQTIWCQSAYTAALALGRAAEFDRENNFRRLYARLIVFQGGYLGRTMASIHRRNKDRSLMLRWWMLLATCGSAVALAISRLLSFGARRARAWRGGDRRMESIHGVRCVSAATREVDARLARVDLPRLLDQVVAAGG